MGQPRAAATHLQRLVASLRGLRITAVDYAVLTCGQDGHQPQDWDYDTRHEPSMGCQITTDIADRFAFVWDNTFGSYGVELHHRPLDQFLAHLGEPYGPILVPVGEHPRWQALLDRHITETELGWIEWASGDPSPCWIRLELEPDNPASGKAESVWLFAGRWHAHGYSLATDDITVIFDRAEAVQAGIATDRQPATSTQTQPVDNPSP